MLSRALVRYLRVAFICLTSGFCCKLLSLLFNRDYYFVSEMEWPASASEQVALKNMVLSPAKVLSAALLNNPSGEKKKLWLLMKQKDCQLLGRIVDRFPTQRLKTEKVNSVKAAALFPLLDCKETLLPKNLIDEQLTFALLKPDLVERGLAMEAIRKIEEHDLRIIGMVRFKFTDGMVEEFYAEHRQRPFFPELREFMTSGESIAMILSGRNGVKQWRGLMGPTDPLKAKKEAFRSIRALYGLSVTQNSCHGSDSQHSATRELQFICKSGLEIRKHAA